MSKKLKQIVSLIILVSVFLGFGTSALFGRSVSRDGNPLDLYQKAVNLQDEKEWYDASQYFLEVVNINPAYSDAWYNLAQCSYMLGEFDLALQYLENAEKYEKNKPEIQNLKGMILLALGENNKAKVIFHDVLKAYPNDIDAHFGLAEIELYEGKITGAEKQYREALKRQYTNRRALLSLALVCAETDRFDESEIYLHQAMQYYSGEPEVHYLAAVIYLMEDNLADAEKHARIAVEIKNSYSDAYELLATILYSQDRYDEVIDICDYLISQERSNGSAWYLKGISQDKLGLHDDAIETLSVGVSIQPQDEIMRMMLELSARENLPLSDPRRAKWAQYHINTAKQYDSRYDKAGSLYEYQRALLIDPKNETARLAYAKILQINGMHEQYYNQLKFIESNRDGKLPAALSDTIEAYESLLEDTIAKKWNVDPFYLDKIRWNIAIFYEDETSSFEHADSNRLTALAAADVFSGIAITSVKTQVTPVAGFGEAFKKSRENNYDYFIIIDFSEGEEDLTLTSTMYSGRTGSEISKDRYYATGNNRFSTALRRFRNGVLDKLTVRGKILDRNGKTVLIDLGRTENVVKDSVFNIVKKGRVKPSDSEVGLYYKENDIVGTLSVTAAGEEVSEAVITKHGFYDQVNIGDEVVLVSVPEEKTTAETPVDNVPNSTDEGNHIVDAEVKGDEFIEEIKRSIEQPAIIDLLRSIY